MSKKATLDPARRLDIYQRIDRDGTLTLQFFDVDGQPFLLDDYTIWWNWKLRSLDTTNVLQLTEGAGLTKSVNQIVMEMTKAQAALFAVKTYFHEIVRSHASLGEKDWITGDANAHNGKFDGLSFDTEDIVINDGNTIIQITITDGSGGTVVTGSQFRGAFDPSGFPGLFPEPPDQQGSGGSGAIVAGDRWYSSGTGDLPDFNGDPFGVVPGTLIEALQGVPGQDEQKWRLF